MGKGRLCYSIGGLKNGVILKFCTLQVPAGPSTGVISGEEQQQLFEGPQTDDLHGPPSVCDSGPDEVAKVTQLAGDSRGAGKLMTRNAQRDREAATKKTVNTSTSSAMIRRTTSTASNNTKMVSIMSHIDLSIFTRQLDTFGTQICIT